MSELSPTKALAFATAAYDAADFSLDDLRGVLAVSCPDIDTKSLIRLNGTAGMFSDVQSGFGFIARLKGARSKEILIASRGTDPLRASDVGTDLNALLVQGPTGQRIHKGFNSTFKSYVQQVDAYLKPQTLGFKPSAIHCVGHSLGGALANLNAAACAELGYNAYMYTLAAPRVGTLPYAEHVSKKFNADHTYRIANASDPVTMVSCYPFIHAPYQRGTYLLNGGMLIVNPANHLLGIGYQSLGGKSWAQLKAESDGQILLLEQTLFPGNNFGIGVDKMLSMPVLHFSVTLLRSINLAINKLLQKIGAHNLMCVNHFSTGAFTTLDQLAEMLARAASVCIDHAIEVYSMYAAVMRFLGRAAGSAKDMTVALLRWSFNLMYSTLTGMASLAVRRLH